MTDMILFCKYFYACNYLPVSCFDGDRLLFSAGFPQNTPIHHSVIPKLFSLDHNPAIHTSADNGFYGLIKEEKSQKYIIVGPAYSSEINYETIRLYMNNNVVSKDREQEIAQFLSAIPQYTYNRFLNLLIFINLIINGNEVSVTDHFSVSEMTFEKEIAVRQTQAAYLARNEQQQHGTYYFEKQLLEYVKLGETEKMKLFLRNAVTQEPLSEGKLADTPLRQAKNLLIGTATMVGKDGAIPGGLDVEQTYQLIDTYIQECEKLQSIDAVKNLQFNMIIDFTNRVSRAKLPEGLSEEVFSCMQFISTHINEHIGVEDVAKHIKKSRAYVSKKFRKEANINIGEYIKDCRMREAKSLLNHTDKSLSEISEYLCFSSQSYFQNVFKKKFGISPDIYRKTKKNI